MIGERIESAGGIPWISSLTVLVGVGLAAAGWVNQSHESVVLAAVPLAFGLSFLIFGRQRAFSATLLDEGIEVEGGERAELIPYDRFENIWVGGRTADPADSFTTARPIVILHQAGVLRIPPRLNFPSHDVYRFLAERLMTSGSRAVNPVLHEFVERQERFYGPENVWTFRAARRRGVALDLRGFRIFILGLILASVAWMVAGFSNYAQETWGIIGVIMGIAGVIGFLVSFADRTSSAGAFKNWRQASVAVSPQGLAMVQGNIEGEVRWVELLDVQFKPKRSSWTSSAYAFPGIVLTVKGARIVILDIYDRPLFVIYDRIMTFSGRSYPIAPEL